VIVAGFLNLLKPPGPTSHDIVSHVRRLAGGAKVGHLGTLDPAAAGVLVLALGPATRLASIAGDGDKEYRAEVTFGIATDTLDAEGAVIMQADASRLTAAEVEAALAAFRGEIEQRPPMYSAVQKDGQRLYQLARAGRTIETPPRRVVIHRLELLRLTPGEHPRALMEVACSGGTYVRTLADDLGHALGGAAYLSFLVRTRVGPFAIADAVTFEELAAAIEREGWGSALLPMDLPLQDLPEIVVDAEGAARLRHGNAIAGDAPVASPWVRVYNDQRVLLALAQPASHPKSSEGGPMWHPKIVLITDPETP
jgi:tRNA pseudouridine55 synthase